MEINNYLLNSLVTIFPENNVLAWTSHWLIVRPVLKLQNYICNAK